MCGDLLLISYRTRPLMRRNQDSQEGLFFSYSHFHISQDYNISEGIFEQENLK